MKLAEAVKNAKRVYLIGNGGSYANAVHICNDLLSVGIKAFTLDPASLTASANDFGYETVFSRWIDIVGEEGDLLIALSGSGSSENILAALGVAQSKGMKTHLMTHYLNGMDMQESEEDQLVVGHQLMKCLKS
jgi:D-sedoheptulose 7-phosphate isomerase